MAIEFYKVDHLGNSTGEHGRGTIKEEGNTRWLYLDDDSQIKLSKGDFIRTVPGIIGAITYRIVCARMNLFEIEETKLKS